MLILLTTEYYLFLCRYVKCYHHFKHVSSCSNSAFLPSTRWPRCFVLLVIQTLGARPAAGNYIFLELLLLSYSICSLHVSVAVRCMQACAQHSFMYDLCWVQFREGLGFFFFFFVFPIEAPTWIWDSQRREGQVPGGISELPARARQKERGVSERAPRCPRRAKLV